MLLVLDIDGTLADHSHRIKHLENGINPKVWKKFLDPDLMIKDPPFEKAQKALKNLLKTKYTTISNIFILTGRNERHEKVTKKWLRKHFNFLYRYPGPPSLFMRPDGEETPATAHKEGVLKAETDPYDRLLLIDDDPYVLNLYSKYGLALKAPECWDLMLHKKPENPEPLFTS